MVLSRLGYSGSQLVVVFMVEQPGETLDAKKLDTFYLDQIARFERPKRYEFVEALQKNNYGKVLKSVLRER